MGSVCRADAAGRQQECAAAAGCPSESVMEAKQSDDHDIDDAAAAAIAEVAAVVAGHSYPSQAAGEGAAEQALTARPARAQAAAASQAGAQSAEVETPPPPERSPSEEEAMLIAHGRSGSILSVLRAADLATAKLAAAGEAHEVMFSRL